MFYHCFFFKTVNPTRTAENRVVFSLNILSEDKILDLHPKA